MDHFPHTIINFSSADAATIHASVLATATNPGEDTLDAVSDAAAATIDFLQLVFGLATGAAIALLGGVIVVALGRVLTRRHISAKVFADAIYRPAQVLLLIIGAWAGFSIARDKELATMPHGSIPAWIGYCNHFFTIVTIISAAWLVVGIVNGLVATIHERMKESSQRRAKRVQTQMQILHRVIVVIVWILGFAGVLLTFPGARAAGASLLASAGVVSVVAGLAAQTMLGNVFAGLQLAFSDSIRVGDVVNYQNNYTTVEEITLTYVVLTVWDGRRIIVPSSILTTESFENWTRRIPEMVGTVELDVDWAVPVAAMRKELNAILLSTDLWDGKTGVLQVTDAVGGTVKIRAVVSAKNSPALTDLRNYVREKLVVWIQHEAPQAIPHNYNWDYEQTHFLEAQQASLEAAEKHLHQVQPQSYPPQEAHIEQRPSQAVTQILSEQEILGLQENTAPVNSASIQAQERLAERVAAPITNESALFSGSEEGDERQRTFAGPGDDAYEERQRELAKSQDKEKNHD